MEVFATLFGMQQRSQQALRSALWFVEHFEPVRRMPVPVSGGTSRYNVCYGKFRWRQIRQFVELRDSLGPWRSLGLLVRRYVVGRRGVRRLGLGR